MSSLVLSGDTSGSVALSVPTVSGTNTLTIQAATGTNAINGQGTAVATTSGTSVTFTDLPSWVKRITLMVSGVSTNAANNLIVQLGTSGGIVSTGYLSSLGVLNAGAGANTSATNGFLISSSNAASVVSGVITITNLTSNTWVYSSVTKSATTIVSSGAGDITLAAVLTQIRLTDTAGTGVFDAGTVNILYEG